MNNLPALSELLKSFYKDEFTCPKTKLNVRYRQGEYVISRNGSVFFRVKEDETFQSELGINKDEVYKIIYDLFISNKEVIRDEFQDFIPKTANPLSMIDAMMKKNKNKKHTIKK